MKRRWNLLLYLGFLLTLVAFLSYFLFFYRFPVTRDIPWANWLLFGMALIALGVGLARAFRQSDVYRGKVSGPILAALSLAIAGMFSYIVFFHTKELPASKQAPQLGQKAPDFTLPDKDCELKGSTQHLLEVYSQESQNLSSFAGVDLSAVRPCPVQIEHSRTGRFS